MRYQVTFEVSSNDEEGFRKFCSDFENKFLGENVLAYSGWLTSKKPTYKPAYNPFDLNQPLDPKWEAILDWIDEQIKSGKPLATRSTAMYNRDGDQITCAVTLYDDRSCETKSLYLVSSRRNAAGQLVVHVKGPFADDNDEYWISMAAHDQKSENAIVTEDWVHRTISKDDPQAVAAGHGGAEFRFKVDQQTAARFERVGIKVDSLRADGTRIVTTHNCWYQGKIPAKHRHLFKVNAEMVKGFNPPVQA